MCYNRFMKIIITTITLLLLVSCSSKNWRDASRESAGIAPKIDELKESIVQIYYARAFSWRGSFGVHPWISWKRANEKQYTVSEVTSWNIRRTGSAVDLRQDIPDRLWYDKEPTVLFEARGEKADKIIDQLVPLINKYPFKSKYVLWPGPNSNTFIAYLIREIKELDIELPPHAVGKDYFGPNQFLSNTASDTGITLSAYGLLGITFGLAEGFEVNLFGAHIGLDLWTPALKLPLLGRVGFKDKSL